MWEQGFLTHWGATNLPVPSLTIQEYAAAAPQMPSADVEQVEAAQGPRQPWEVGRADATRAWSSQALRVPGGGTCLHGSEGPEESCLRGHHVFGVALLPPRTPLSHPCIGAPMSGARGSPEATGAQRLSGGRPWGRNPRQVALGTDATRSLQLPDLPLGIPSCGHLTVTVGCRRSSPEGQDVLGKSCTHRLAVSTP